MIVALVATNFDRSQRPRAYGLVAAAALGPLIGGLLTTYASWRWVFASEVVIVLAILVLARRMADAPADHSARLDLAGTVLSAARLGLVALAALFLTGGIPTRQPAAEAGPGLTPPGG